MSNNTNTNNFYDAEILKQIQINLNTKHSTELAELVDMTFGPKPEPELQRLNDAQVIGIDQSGIRISCRYHRWETAEQNDRMFREHTDETNRIYTIPFAIQPQSENELISVIDQMIGNAQTSYLKGFE